jgi:MFS family permease
VGEDFHFSKMASSWLLRSKTGKRKRKEKNSEGGIIIFKNIFYGWWVVVSATIVMSALGVIFYGFGILFPSILKEFEWSRTLTSSIYSVQITVNSLFILIMGYLIDRYSPRIIVSLGALLLSSGLILSSLTEKIWHLYLFFGFMVGAGTSTMYVPPITVVTRWFEKRRGLSIGIAVTGIGIGGFLGSPFLNWLIHQFGWRTALTVLGIIIGIMVLLAATIFIGHPEKKGLSPYGKGGNEEDGQKDSTKTYKFPSMPGERAPIHSWTVWNAVKTRSFLLLYIMMFFAETALVGVMAHLFAHAMDMGIPKSKVSWAYGFIGIASLIGKIGIGALSDKIGRKGSFFLSFVLKGTAFLFLLPHPTVFLLFLFAIVLGLSYGGWTPLFPAILGDFYGLESMGKIFSILTTNFLLGGICGPILAGLIFDKMGSYFMAFFIFSAISYGAAIFSLFLKAPQIK